MTGWFWFHCQHFEMMQMTRGLFQISVHHQSDKDLCQRIYIKCCMNPLMQKVIKVHFNGNNKKSTNCFGENLLQVCLVTSADGLAFFSMPLNKRFWWLNGGEGFRGSLSLPFLHNCSDLYFKGHFNFYMLTV